MRDIGQAVQRSGRPPGHNPKGRGHLRRGGVARLARSPATRGTPLLTAPQMAPAQAIPFGRTMLYHQDPKYINLFRNILV